MRSRRPEKDDICWVAAFEIVMPGPCADSNGFATPEIVYYFATEQSAREACEKLRYAKTKDGRIALSTWVLPARTYYSCSFCNGQLRDGVRFFRNDDGNAVCSECVTAFSAQIIIGQ